MWLGCCQLHELTAMNHILGKSVFALHPQPREQIPHEAQLIDRGPWQKKPSKGFLHGGDPAEYKQTGWRSLWRTPKVPKSLNCNKPYPYKP